MERQDLMVCIQSLSKRFPRGLRSRQLLSAQRLIYQIQQNNTQLQQSLKNSIIQANQVSRQLKFIILASYLKPLSIHFLSQGFYPLKSNIPLLIIKGQSNLFQLKTQSQLSNPNRQTAKFGLAAFAPTSPFTPSAFSPTVNQRDYNKVQDFTNILRVFARQKYSIFWNAYWEIRDKLKKNNLARHFRFNKDRTKNIEIVRRWRNQTHLQRLQKRGIIMSLMKVFRNKLSKFLQKFKHALKKQAKQEMNRSGGVSPIILSPGISQIQQNSFIGTPIQRRPKLKTSRMILRNLFDNIELYLNRILKMNFMIWQSGDEAPITQFITTVIKKTGGLPTINMQKSPLRYTNQPFRKQGQAGITPRKNNEFSVLRKPITFPEQIDSKTKWISFKQQNLFNRMMRQLTTANQKKFPLPNQTLSKGKFVDSSMKNLITAVRGRKGPRSYICQESFLNISIEVSGNRKGSKSVGRPPKQSKIADLQTKSAQRESLNNYISLRNIHLFTARSLKNSKIFFFRLKQAFQLITKSSPRQEKISHILKQALIPQIQKLLLKKLFSGFSALRNLHFPSSDILNRLAKNEFFRVEKILKRFQNDLKKDFFSIVSGRKPAHWQQTEATRAYCSIILKKLLKSSKNRLLFKPFSKFFTYNSQFDQDSIATVPQTSFTVASKSTLLCADQPSKLIAFQNLLSGIYISDLATAYIKWFSSSTFLKLQTCFESDEIFQNAKTRNSLQHRGLFSRHTLLLPVPSDIHDYIDDMMEAVRVQREISYMSKSTTGTSKEVNSLMQVSE